MTERIGAKVAIMLRVRRTADTEGIQNEKKCSCHNSPKRKCADGQCQAELSL
jgi:hypothetical protein